MQRGRKSAASLSVVAGTIDGRPEPPKDLTPFQKDVWKKTVGSENAAFFKTAALQQLLKEYCRHVESAHVLAQSINEFSPEWLATDEGISRYGELLKLRDRETKAVADKATKLRLTNQSRWQPAGAASAAKNMSTEAKPWERRTA